MDPRKLFIDERLTGICSYCGNRPDTRDHIPSRVLLDEPFPHNLPVVDACRSCNESFSEDEVYVACLIECAICGTTKPSEVKRPKIARILNYQLLLARRISESCSKDSDGSMAWRADIERVQNVILKLARGHMAFDLSLPTLEEPNVLAFKPLITMSEEEYAAFESPPELESMLFPEIGSRAFVNMWKLPQTTWNDWQVIQPGRYRYRIWQSPKSNTVQFVLSEYLACWVVWV